MSSVLSTRADKIVAQFQALSDWEARYKLLIDLGRQAPELADEFKTEENKIRGCQSQVWMRAWLDPNQRVQFEADSDALLVKGLVSILVQVYSNTDPSEILQFPPEFIKQLGFDSNLSPSRTNGLHAMLKQIKNFAIAFHYQLHQKKSH
ncbi:MAG: SufE family protein [Bdellovibrionaceae bacterium]|nr:SufE family protein [Pseudobdellovibrionaceae bacterium]